MNKLGRRIIAYVEDSDADALAASEALRALNVINPLRRYRNAEELLQALAQNGGEENKPDVLLVDMSLPGMQGLDLIRHVREHHPDMETTPIIVVTGNDDVGAIAEARNAGAEVYVGKPLTFFNFYHALRVMDPDYGIAIVRKPGALVKRTAATA